MTDPLELLSALDAPRPLSTELRARLEDALLSVDQPRALDAGLAARLTTRMTDRVAELFVGLDAPRPLPASVRAALDDGLVRRRRRGLWVGFAAAASVLGVSGAAGLTAERPHAGAFVCRVPPAPFAR